MEKIIIFGGGGLGLEVIAYFKDLDNKKYQVVGIIDEGNIDINSLSKESNNKLNIYKSINDAPINDHKFIICVMDTDVRARAYKELCNLKASFVSMIHPSAFIAKSAKIGQGVIICPNVYIAPKAIVSDNTISHIFSSVGHEASIGQSSFLGPRASLLGNSICEDEVSIGFSSNVNVGIKVGRKSKLSYNSTLNNNCPAGSLAFGIPAKHKIVFK